VADDRFARIYFDRIARDPKFDGVRHSRNAFGAWSLLLVEAEKAWPADFIRPPWVSAADLRALVMLELVDEKGDGMYAMHGLDAERTRRSKHASDAAASRWGTAAGGAGSNAPGIARGNASHARAPRLVSSSSSSTSGGGVGEGLPNITDDVAIAATAATGLGILAFGDRAQTELDRLCERHDGPAVIAAMDTVLQAIPRPSPNQLVFGVVKVLEPFLDPKAAQKLAGEQAATESSRRGVLATIRQAHGYGAHEATPDPLPRLRGLPGGAAAHRIGPFLQVVVWLVVIVALAVIVRLAVSR
jgi:hypothetical protein